MHRRYLNKEALTALSAVFSTIVFEERDEGAILTEANTLPALCAFLKDEATYDFDRLGSLTAVDRSKTIELVCHLHSSHKGHTVEIKAQVARENPVAPSLTALWPSANFQEREIYDLFGVRFAGHPDLRRILLPDDFEGYPLRKDFKAKAARPEAGC